MNWKWQSVFREFQSLKVIVGFQIELEMFNRLMIEEFQSQLQESQLVDLNKGVEFFINDLPFPLKNSRSKNIANVSEGPRL